MPRTDADRAFRSGVADTMSEIASISQIGAREERNTAPKNATRQEKYIVTKEEIKYADYLNLENGDYINIEKADPWDSWTGDDNFVFEILYRSESQTQQKIIYAVAEGTTSPCLQLTIREGGSIRGYISDGDNEHEAEFNNRDIRDGGWHRITWMRYGADSGETTSMRLWIDGSEQATGGASPPTVAVGSLLYDEVIYISDPDGNYGIIGDIADFRVVDGTPWWIDSNNIYNNDMINRRATGSEAGLRDACYLRIDEGSGAEIIDRTPRKISATATINSGDWETEERFISPQRNYVFYYELGEYSYAIVEAGDDTDLESELTIEAVFRATEISEDGFYPLVRWSAEGIQYGIIIQQDRWGLVLDDSTYWKNRTVELNEIKHVAMTWDGTTVKGYWAGVLDVEETHDTALAITGDTLSTMVGPDGSGAGWLDEIRLWDDALTQEELDEIRRREIDETRAGLVGYWRLNELSGMITVDHSGAEFNGPTPLYHMVEETETESEGEIIEATATVIQGGVQVFELESYGRTEPDDLSGDEWLGAGNFNSAENVVEPETGTLETDVS